jgi:hypothetical protein
VVAGEEAMIAVAFLLLVSGITLIGGATYGLRRHIPEKLPNYVVQCGALSPDGQSACRGEVVHNGWCSDGHLEWYGDAWMVSAYDDTQAAPTMVVDDAMTESLPHPPPDRSWVEFEEPYRLPRIPTYLQVPARWAGTGMICGAFWLVGKIATNWPG